MLSETLRILTKMEGASPLIIQTNRVPPPQIKKPEQKSFRQKSSFDLLVEDKTPIAIGSVAGAITGFCTATPMAKFFVKKGVDRSFNTVSKRADNIRDLFFKDLSKKEFHKIIKNLQKDQLKVEELADIVALKMPETLKILGLNETQTNLIMKKNVEPTVSFIKQIKLKNLKTEEIEQLRIDSIRENKKIFIFMGKFLNIKGKDSDETVKIVRNYLSKNLDLIGKRSQKALNPIKNELIDRYVKATPKYKIAFAIIGGLSVAGLVGLFKPVPKNSQN